MNIKPFFSSSSKVWDSYDWVYGIEEAGYEGWEISADGNYRLDKKENVEKIMETLDSTSLDATVHAPFTDLNPASINYPIHRETIRQLSICIENAADFTGIVTMHPGYLSPAGRLVPEKVWEMQKNALVELGKVAIENGILLCLENMPDIPGLMCTRKDEIFGITDGIEGVGVTVDLGHANTCGEVDAFLKGPEYWDHVHIHDNNGTIDEHLPLGEGIMDWEKIGKTLSEKYSGICVVEGRSIEEGRISLEVFRRWFR